jgi:hypothetical protein
VTVTSFVDLISKWTEAQGQAFLTDTGDIVDLVNRESKRFALDTLCLYSDSITFTLTVGTAKYSMRDTAVFSKMIALPLAVWIDNEQLKRLPQVPDMGRMTPTFHTDSNNSPDVWYTMPPNHLVLRPAPDSAYSNCYVEGWHLPDDLDVAVYGASDDVIEFPDEVIDPLALHCAIALMEPRATGELVERVGYLRKMNEEQKQAIRSRADEIMQPSPMRKGRNTRYSLG